MWYRSMVAHPHAIVVSGVRLPLQIFYCALLEKIVILKAIQNLGIRSYLNIIIFFLVILIICILNSSSEKLFLPMIHEASRASLIDNLFDI